MADETGLDPTERLAAAIFAAATCIGLNRHDPLDYLTAYDALLSRMSDAKFAAMDAAITKPKGD